MDREERGGWGDKGMKRAALLFAGGGRRECKWVSDSLGMKGKSMKNQDFDSILLNIGPQPGRD